MGVAPSGQANTRGRHSTARLQTARRLYGFGLATGSPGFENQGGRNLVDRMQYKFISSLILISSALAIAACGSSGGNGQPPAPPVPVAPPPPLEPTFEERLADLAEFDPNPCRADTPGFEALGGWLKNDGRELGNSRVWIGGLRDT